MSKKTIHEGNQDTKGTKRNDANPKNQYGIMLNAAIKEANNPEAAKIKSEIDEIRRLRSGVIYKIKENRRRLAYKEAEGAAIAKLLEIEKLKEKNAGGNSRGKRIGYLLRLKNKLEFRISTEASSLSAEKDLVRQIESVNKELSEAYRKVKLERKSGFIKSDIVQFSASLAQLDKQIEESDKKLDELYSKLRKILGISRDHSKQRAAKKKLQLAPLQEINLEDIAIIKKREKKAEEE